MTAPEVGRVLPEVECRCSRIRIGTTLTDIRNWTPECPAHGTESAWWKSPEQVAKRVEQSERLRNLQRRAREARTAHSDEPEGRA